VKFAGAGDHELRQIGNLARVDGHLCPPEGVVRMGLCSRQYRSRASSERERAGLRLVPLRSGEVTERDGSRGPRRG
jgi:hypothetical protein